MAYNDKNKFSPGGVCDTSPCRSCGQATKSCSWSECPKFKKWFGETWARLRGKKEAEKK